MKQFWIVWNGSPISYNLLAYKHDSLTDARMEAERLARQSPGQTFFVLVAVASCQKVDVQWTEINPDGKAPL